MTKLTNRPIYPSNFSDSNSEKVSRASQPANYLPIIGMEVHAELKTNSKMFCGCKNDPFHAKKPNIYTCPVCLGMPGGLPVANKKAIEWTIKLGLALNCKINLFSKFDRKNYFYPDLAKGYQISQYDIPFCYDGVLETDEGSVRIRRIHLEEDTGKLQHKTIEGKKVSLIDFNRSGVPLIEIVTEPDIHSASHAKAYAKKLRQIIRFLDISDCDMEQGSMRLEANISLLQTTDQPANRQLPTELPNYKVEVKNINSFTFLEKAIQYEVKRHEKILGDGQTPSQETRGWDEDNNQTFSQRSKENAEDYRYFPDPDLPPIQFTQKQIDQLSSELPELPDSIISRWKIEYEIDPKSGLILTETPAIAQQANTTFVLATEKKISVKNLVNAWVNKKIKVSENSSAKEIIAQFIELTKTDDVSDQEIESAIQTVLDRETDAVNNYKAGKVQVIGFLMGQVMKELKKKVDPKRVNSVLQKTLTAL